jgi:hypothetical protein
LLHDADILFARSGATAGKTFIYEREIGPAIFAGYCIRFRFDSSRVLPWFVYFCTKTEHYAEWVRSTQRPAGQPNINKEEFKAFTIPVPSRDKQRALVGEVQAAREARNEKLRRADALLASLDNYLLDILGLTPVSPDERAIFAVKLGQIKGKRIDPPAYRPFFARDKPPKTPLCPLAEIAAIDPHQVKRVSVETLVPYVGLPECDLTEVREVALRPYREVKGRSIVKPGDILFARIEPSVFNKKYVLVEDLKGHDYAYTSTEFYVVKPREVVNLYYLYGMFFCSFVFAQTKGKTTGSSGRRRLDPEMFAALQIPVPEKHVQEQIAAEVRRRREEARRLRTEAEVDWAAAKRRFEEQLLGDS